MGRPRRDTLTAVSLKKLSIVTIDEIKDKDADTRKSSPDVEEFFATEDRSPKTVP